MPRSAKIPEIGADAINEILFGAGKGVGNAVLESNDRLREALFKPFMSAIRTAYNLGYADGLKDAETQ